MGTQKLYFFWIFCLIFICSVFVQSKQSNYTNNPVIFELIAKDMRRGSTQRLPFHHNVSLTVSLLVGTPRQPVTMVLDTGSELSWLHCKKSPDVNSLFDPVHSTSYNPVPCTSPVCSTRTRDLTIPVSCDPRKLCHAMVGYADMSTMEGTLAMDNFVMGGLSVPGVVFGCMDSGSSSSGDDSGTTGLLGMNRGSLSFVTQMNYPKFSYCISGQDSSGVLLFGDANVPWLKELSYTPLVQMSSPYPLPYFDRVAYSLHFEGIKVGTKLLNLPQSILQPDHTGAGQTMVDSGTQFTFLLGPAYTALKNEFLAQTKGTLRDLGEPNFVFQGAMDLCFRIPLSQTSYPPLPTVTLLFQGAEMSVSTERLLYRVPGEVRGPDGVHCFTFGNSELLGAEAYIIGHHHQQNMWMEFDLQNSRVGLAEVRCDLASKKLVLGL
ncbi:aspartic proteinase PCS1-like [Silene latifolia]|uniref:aspartic proteinase PCS1-like n=1 Tax=Silene latifolia TaxID=37657 RepID=UPI003D781B2C